MLASMRRVVRVDTGAAAWASTSAHACECQGALRRSPGSSAFARTRASRVVTGRSRASGAGVRWRVSQSRASAELTSEP